MPSQTDLQGSRVSVIGASGFIGRHTVARLLAQGAEVVAVARRAPAEPSGPRCRWVEGDIADEAVARAALEGVQAVVYLASTSLPASANAAMAREIRTHVEAPVRTAELAAAQGTRRFVFASSGGTVYGPAHAGPIREEEATDALNAYGVSKIAVEGYLRVLTRLKRLSAVSLRISNPYGEHQTALRGQGFVSAAMAAAFAGTPLPIWGDGSVVRDYIHIDDVARALVAAVGYEGPHAAFNIGSGQGRSLLEVVAAVEAVSGRTIALRLESERAIDVPMNVLDITRAVEALGWRPTIALSEGLARTAEWWRSTPRSKVSALELEA